LQHNRQKNEDLASKLKSSFVGEMKMHTILEKRQLSADVFYFKVNAPDIARNRKAGQFVLIQLDIEYGERIPLTIADANAVEGWIALVFQTVGATTFLLSRKQEGDKLAAVLGPLGNPTHIEKKNGSVVVVGGGIGVAPCYPIVEAHKKIGNKVIVIVAARTKELLIFVEEMKAIADEVIIMTDDGSAGRQGVSTLPLKEICESKNPPAEVVAIGPPIMMKFCAATTKPFNVPTIVSLNTIMIDGTGMCGCCRVSIGGKTKFVCVDGPEFDGHLVDWDNMMMRMKSFKERETEDFHKCKLQAQADALAAGEKNNV
jgi:ferredoxin--NADP+ reductase